MTERWDDPVIAGFFEEFDRRVEGTSGVAHEADSRALLALARPKLVALATQAPEVFVAVVENFFRERRA